MKRERSVTEKPPAVTIKHLTDANAPSICDLFEKGLGWMGLVFQARKTACTRDGESVDLGPDYRTRIAGLRSLLNMCVQGRRPLEAPVKENIRILAEHLREMWGQIILDKAGYSRPELEPTSEKPKPAARPTRTSVNLVQLVDESEKKVHELFAAGLNSLAGVFEARRTKLGMDGDVLDLGPDYSVGHSALQMLTDLGTHGREPICFPESEEKKPTLQDFNDYLESEEGEKEYRAASERIDAAKRRLAGLPPFEVPSDAGKPIPWTPTPQDLEDLYKSVPYPESGPRNFDMSMAEARALVTELVRSKTKATGPINLKFKNKSVTPSNKAYEWLKRGWG